jgi:transposase
VELYKRRNEVERFFRRLKAFRRVFTRYDKLDVMYASFVNFAIICEFLRE